MGQLDSAPARRLCRLKVIAGTPELCPEAECALWEPGGAALGGRCAFEQIDLEGRPEFAAWLLGVREALESNAQQAQDNETRRLFNRLLNESQGE
jgi:hypothetical protein